MLLKVLQVLIIYCFNPELQAEDTESAIISKLIDFLTWLKGFKFVTTFFLVFKKLESEDKTRYNNFCSNSKPEIIINEKVIDDVFQPIYTIIILNIQKSYVISSDWLLIQSLIILLVFQSIALKLPIELDHPRNELTNIQNIDGNECFKWSIVRYLNPTDHNPRRIIKADKDLDKKVDFKEIKFPVKFGDIHKIEKKNSINLSVFCYENKEKLLVYVSRKCSEEKHVDLSIIGEEGNREYVLIKNFNTFMFDHILKTALKLIANKEL